MFILLYLAILKVSLTARHITYRVVLKKTVIIKKISEAATNRYKLSWLAATFW